MKTILIALLMMTSWPVFSQTQAEMNQAAYDDFNISDQKLNDVYQAILTQYQSDTLFVQQLRSSQRLWIQFRDAELAMKYPNYPDRMYGSIHPTCRAYYLKDLTDQRIETLKEWLNGSIEGDACMGSVIMIGHVDESDCTKAFIAKDSTISLTANLKKDHRIIGYRRNHVYSEKLIVLSIFTNEVESNPFGCKYGSYYDTSGMMDLELKFLGTEGDFLRVAILKNGASLDEVFMEKRWFAFEGK